MELGSSLIGPMAAPPCDRGIRVPAGIALGIWVLGVTMELGSSLIGPMAAPPGDGAVCIPPGVALGIGETLECVPPGVALGIGLIPRLGVALGTSTGR